MKRTTPGIVMMLAAFVASIGLASAATAADNDTATATRTVKSKVVHQGADPVDVTYERRVIKVSALPDDSQCGSWSFDRRVVTYDPQDCAPSTYGAHVVVRNDNGSRSRTRLNMTVEKNRLVKTPAQTEANRRELVNRDSAHPVRCDYSRSGDVVMGRFIPAAGSITIFTTDDDLDYACYYADGAHAGYGTIDVRRVNTGTYLVDHPKMELVTLGCNAERNNESGVCKITGPDGWSRTITVPAGEKDKEHFNYHGTGEYYVSTLDFHGDWQDEDPVHVTDPSSRIK